MPSQPARQVQRYLPRIDHGHFHSLRHTFGTRMAAAGVPMRTLQEWMGYRNLATTEIYADYVPDPAYGAAFAENAFTAKRDRQEAERSEKAHQDALSSHRDGAAGAA